MRLMTGLAAFKSHRSMFEGKRPAFVAMAFETSRLIGREALDASPAGCCRADCGNPRSSCRLREACDGRAAGIGPTRLSGSWRTACCCVGLADHQRFARMHFVAGCAGDLVVCVAAFQPAHLRGLIQMAGETDFVGRRGSELRRILDVVGRRPFGVRLPRTVAGLAFAALPSPLGVDSQRVMRVLGEPVIDVFVADLAGLRIPRNPPAAFGRLPTEEQPPQSPDRVQLIAIASYQGSPAMTIEYARRPRRTARRRMAYRAAFTQRIGIGQEVRRLGLGNVASAASRSGGLHRIDPALRIGDLIQVAHQRQVVLLRAIDVAHRAVLQIGSVSGSVHGREEHAGEVVMAPHVAHHDVRVLRPAGTRRSPRRECGEPTD